MEETLGVLCAMCIRTLPRPDDWTFRDGDQVLTLPVKTFEEAMQAHARGYRYVDENFAVYGLYAKTFVDGTALCYSHAYFAMGRKLDDV